MSEVRYEFVAVDKNLSKVIENIDKTLLKMDATANKTGSTIDAMFQKMNKGVGKTNKNVNTLASSMKKLSNIQLLNFNPKSINETNAVISELIKRRNELNISDKKYSKSLSLINRKIQQLNKSNQKAISLGENVAATNKKLISSYHGQSNAISQVRNQLAMMFSIYGAQRFIKEMVKVRGEFELQAVALGAMLQNKQLANDMFQEVQQMALKSPFKILELNKYLKQLKAYRIENDELIGSLKMLGDISAGLGVSMDRLILAYGQVKAASVLRGQELRQFTEAGIPLVDALAQKFTELNGKLVTTGEVFELISKRQVSFEMIKDIFKDMTSEGGVFFDQQRLQSETLSGQLSVLRDAYDKMLNAMGKSNEGTFKSMIKGARELIDNYEIVIKVLKTLIITYGTYKALKIGYYILFEVKALKKLAVALRLATAEQVGLNTAVSSNVYLAIASAIIGVIIAIRQYIKYQEELNQKILDSVKPLKEKAAALHELQIKYNSLSTTEEERIKIMSKIAQNNPEIVEGYRNEGKAIDEVNKKLKEQVNIYTDLAILKLKDAQDVGYLETKKKYDAEKEELNKLKETMKLYYSDIFAGINKMDREGKDVSIFKNILNSEKEPYEKVVDMYREFRNLEIFTSNFKAKGGGVFEAQNEYAKELQDIFKDLRTPKGWFSDSDLVSFEKATSKLKELKSQLKSTEKELLNAAAKYAAAMYPDNKEQQQNFLGQFYETMDMVKFKADKISNVVWAKWQKDVDAVIAKFDVAGKQMFIAEKPNVQYSPYVEKLRTSWKEVNEEIGKYNIKKAKAENRKDLIAQYNELTKTKAMYLAIAKALGIWLEKKSGGGGSYIKSLQDELKYLKEIRQFYLSDKSIIQYSKQFGDLSKKYGIDIEDIFGDRAHYKDVMDKYTDVAYKSYLEGLKKQVESSKAGGTAAGKSFIAALEKEISDVDTKNLLDANKLIVELEKEVNKININPFGKGATLKLSEILSKSKKAIDDINNYELKTQLEINNIIDKDKKAQAQKEFDIIKKNNKLKIQGIKDQAIAQTKAVAKLKFNEDLGVDLYTLQHISDATLTDLKKLKLTIEDINISNIKTDPKLQEYFKKVGITADEFIVTLKKIKKDSVNLVEDKLFNKYISYYTKLGVSITELGDAFAKFDNKHIADVGSAIAGLASQTQIFANALKAIHDDNDIGKFNAIVDSIMQLTNIIIDSYQKRKKAEEDFYRDAAKAQQEYNIKQIESIRNQKKYNDNIFSDDWMTRIQNGLKAADEAQKQLNDVFDQFSKGKVKIDIADAIDWNNVGKAAGAGAAAGATIGTMIGGPIGTGIGAGIGAVVGGLSGLFGGKKTKDVFGGLMQNYPDLIKSNGELNEELAQTLIDTNQLDDATKLMLENAIDLSEQYKEAMEQVKEVVSEIAGNIGDNLRDALVDSFINGTNAAEKFKGTLEDVLEQLVATKAFNVVFGQLFDNLENDLTNAMATSSNQDDIDVLNQFWQDAISKQEEYNKLLKTAQESAENVGFDLFKTKESEQKGLSSGIQSMTEDTANILASYLNTIRYQIILQTGYVEQILHISQTTQSMITQQLSHLSKIESNTLRIANILESSQNGTRVLHVA